MAERETPGREWGVDDATPPADGRPVWRPATVGALVSIVLLVAATVGAAIWLSIIDQRTQAQAQLTRQAHHVALQIRGRLVETEQLLLMEGRNYRLSTQRFRSDMTELLQANPALLRVELREPDGTLLAAVDAPSPRPTLPIELRTDLGVETRGAIELAARLNRLTYSTPYFTQLGSAGMDLLELVVPTGEAGGPLVVAIYAPQRMLDHFIPLDLPPDMAYSMVEADGTMVARQSIPGQARAGPHAIAPLARTGTTLHLRVDGLQQVPRLIPNLLTGLVAATSVGLGIALVLLILDIRRRAGAEQALREQVRFRRSIEDAMLHALVVLDLQGRVVHVNAALCRLTGFRRDELVGLNGLPIVTPESERDRAAYLDRLERVRERGDSPQSEASRGFESVFRTRSGETFPALVFEMPVLGADGAPVGRMMLCVDLTEQKRIEDLARRQQEALQARSRLATLGEMASTLSHELNQPLAAITSYAAACENLIDLQPPRPEPVRQALRGIRTQAERAGQVIRSVQSFLRRRAVERTEVDLGALVRGLEPLLRLQAARTGARIDLDVPADTRVFADRIMLEQVLLNLTRNGFEAMAEVPQAQRVLTLTARPAAGDERGDRIEVSVADRGQGVPPEVVPQLFNAFFTTKREGMGLGLSLCRSVIEQHGGQLVHRERPDGGTVFAFDLPGRRDTDPRQSDAPIAALEPGAPG